MFVVGYIVFLLQEMFYSVESILKRFLDIDHLLPLCVQVAKHDNIKAAESKITKVSSRDTLCLYALRPTMNLCSLFPVDICYINMHI